MSMNKRLPVDTNSLFMSFIIIPKKQFQFTDSRLDCDLYNPTIQIHQRKNSENIKMSICPTQSAFQGLLVLHETNDVRISKSRGEIRRATFLESMIERIWPKNSGEKEWVREARNFLQSQFMKELSLVCGQLSTQEKEKARFIFKNIKLEKNAGVKDLQKQLNESISNLRKSENGEFAWLADSIDHLIKLERIENPEVIANTKHEMANGRTFSQALQISIAEYIAKSQSMSEENAGKIAPEICYILLDFNVNLDNALSIRENALKLQRNSSKSYAEKDFLIEAANQIIGSKLSEAEKKKLESIKNSLPKKMSLIKNGDHITAREFDLPPEKCLQFFKDFNLVLCNKKFPNGWDGLSEQMYKDSHRMKFSFVDAETGTLNTIDHGESEKVAEMFLKFVGDNKTLQRNLSFFLTQIPTRNANEHFVSEYKTSSDEQFFIGSDQSTEKEEESPEGKRDIHVSSNSITLTKEKNGTFTIKYDFLKKSHTVVENYVHLHSVNRGHSWHGDVNHENYGEWITFKIRLHEESLKQENFMESPPSPEVILEPKYLLRIQPSFNN